MDVECKQIFCSLACALIDGKFKHIQKPSDVAGCAVAAAAAAAAAIAGVLGQNPMKMSINK